MRLKFTCKKCHERLNDCVCVEDQPAMDLVIRVDGRFVRLSPFNRELMKDAGGMVMKLSFEGGFYVLDEVNGVEMRDVTVAWRDR